MKLFTTLAAGALLLAAMPAVAAEGQKDAKDISYSIGNTCFLAIHPRVYFAFLSHYPAISHRSAARRAGKICI